MRPVDASLNSKLQVYYSTTVDNRLMCFSIGYIIGSFIRLLQASSSRTRVFLRCHWSKPFVELCFLTPHWTLTFDRAHEGRPLRQRKKNSSRSEYQSERCEGVRKRKRKTRSGRSARQTASKLSNLSDSSSRADRMTHSAFKSLTRRF